MSDEARNTDPGADAQPEPSIPDGGLEEAMPDWLRRPPAWRGLPMPELPADDAPEPAPVPLAEVAADGVAPTALPDAKDLPAPDTSPIDPSTLIDPGDLPAWLVGLGQRELGRKPVSSEGAPEESLVVGADRALDDEGTVPLPPFLSGDASADMQPEPERLVVLETPDAVPEVPWRLILLAVALLIVVGVAIMLAVAG